MSYTKILRRSPLGYFKDSDPLTFQHLSAAEGLLELCDIDAESNFWYYGFAVPYDVLNARVSTYAASTGLNPSGDAAVYLDHKIHRQFVALGLRELLIETPIPSDLKATFAAFTKSTACYVYAILMATKLDERYVDERQGAIEAAWEMLDKEMGGLCGGFRVPHPEWHWGGLKTVFYIKLFEWEKKEREEKESEEKKREEEKREEMEREEREHKEKEQTSNAVDALQSSDTAQGKHQEHTANAHAKEHNVANDDNHKGT